MVRYILDMGTSIHVDGVEIKDPSPWLAEANRLAAESAVKVQWMEFRMAGEVKLSGARGLFCHTSTGKVHVKHFDADKQPIDVPMVTRAEQNLLTQIDLCAAMNMASLAVIEFIADPADAEERVSRSRVFKSIPS